MFIPLQSKKVKFLYEETSKTLKGLDEQSSVLKALLFVKLSCVSLLERQHKLSNNVLLVIWSVWCFY